MLRNSLSLVFYKESRVLPVYQHVYKILHEMSGYWVFVDKCGYCSKITYSPKPEWVVGSILHGVDPLSYFSFQPVLHDWCNKGCGMCYPVCGMMHIKEPLLLIEKSSPCGSSGFPLSLSEMVLYHMLYAI